MDQNSCIISKLIESETNMQIEEKRSKESMRLSINNYGFKRAKYKVQMLKKYELKNIINQYLSLFNANNESNTSIGKNKSGSINNICKQSSILKTNKMNSY